jgi:hypothetical protein
LVGVKEGWRMIIAVSLYGLIFWEIQLYFNRLFSVISLLFI